MDAVVLVVDSGDVVAEGLVLVALFHVAALSRTGLQSLRLGFQLLVPPVEPLGQLQWLLGGENCLVPVQQRQLNASLRPLPALGLHKVDGGVAHEVCRKKIGRPN